MNKKELENVLNNYDYASLTKCNSVVPGWVVAIHKKDSLLLVNKKAGIVRRILHPKALELFHPLCYTYSGTTAYDLFGELLTNESNQIIHHMQQTGKTCTKCNGSPGMYEIYHEETCNQCSGTGKKTH